MILGCFICWGFLATSFLLSDSLMPASLMMALMHRDFTKFRSSSPASRCIFVRVNLSTNYSNIPNPQNTLNQFHLIHQLHLVHEQDGIYPSDDVFIGATINIENHHIKSQLSLVRTLLHSFSCTAPFVFSL